MKVYLFSYGTLQKHAVQLQLFGRLLTGSRDRLRGYRSFTVEIDDQAFLLRGEEKQQQSAGPSGDISDGIEGMALEIAEADLVIADKYEPEGYERVRVTLESGKQAWMYMAKKIA